MTGRELLPWMTKPSGTIKCTHEARDDGA